MNQAEEGYAGELRANLDRLAGFASAGPDAGRVLVALQRRGRRRTVMAGTGSLLVFLTGMWLLLRPASVVLNPPPNEPAPPVARLAVQSVPTIVPAIPSWQMKIPVRSVQVTNLAWGPKPMSRFLSLSLSRKMPDTSLRLAVPSIAFLTTNK